MVRAGRNNGPQELSAEELIATLRLLGFERNRNYDGVLPKSSEYMEYALTNKGKAHIIRVSISDKRTSVRVIPLHKTVRGSRKDMLGHIKNLFIHYGL